MVDKVERIVINSQDRRENSQILTYSSQKNTGSNFSCTIRKPLHAFAYSIKKVIIP
eukprot:CAMPEP_0117441372 /NCGR_PEP_ID=MMETSP0759-20121206/3602_1 /TAXON_ID=63605 /ORGANISM="Percolomonas cosmopolitus, Strain WS" /LENGTH=55 /DNA_ID=CAMNT_0005233227 /DNA_START=50 /DNA_END=213 /DNA_ORIENTATION=+